MKKVAIIVDDVVRDLLPLSLLAIELKKNNLIPILVPSRIQLFEIKIIKPEIIIINYLRKENESLVRLYKKAGIHIFLLDQEGGAFKSFDFYQETKLSNDEKLRNMIDGVFNWSKSIQSESIKRNWFAKSKNILTGHPKYDIYFKLKDESNFSNKNNILLFTSFTLANPRLASKNSEVNTWSATGGTRNQLKNMQIQQTESFNIYINQLEKIFSKNQNRKFVVKIHPFESDVIYHEKFNRFENVDIIQEPHVYELLEYSCLALHISSTTSIECILKNVVPINLRFLKNPIDIELINHISINCETETELMSVFQNIDQVIKNYSFEKSEDILNQYFETLDGKSAFRIAEYLNDYSRKSEFSTLFNFKYLKRHHLEKNIFKKIILYLFSWSETVSQFSFTNGISQIRLWEKSIKYFNSNLIHKMLKGLDIPEEKFVKFNNTNSITTN